MKQLQIAPGHALFVLTTLVSEGVVKPHQVKRQLDRIPSEVATLEARLAVLRGPSRRKISVNGRTGRYTLATPEVRASRELQGRYMGLMRHVSLRDRAKAKAICKREGREAAVRFLASVTGS